MKFRSLTASIAATVSIAIAPSAFAQGKPDTEAMVNTMVRLCLDGGSIQALSVEGSAGADFALRSLDANGKVKGEVKINRSSAEGIVDGISRTLTPTQTAEADKVRECLRPVREALLKDWHPADAGPVPKNWTSPDPESMRTASEIARVSHGDMFISALVDHVDGAEVGDRIVLHVSRPVYGEEFEKVVVHPGVAIICHVDRLRGEDRVEAKCDHLVIDHGRTIGFSGYLADRDGSKGLAIRPFSGNQKLFGKEVLVQLTES